MYTISNNCPSEVNEEIGAVFTDEKADNEVKNMHRFLDWLNKGKLLTEIGRIALKFDAIRWNPQTPYRNRQDRYKHTFQTGNILR